MERHDGDLVQWIETFELAPGARETWTCCLEPGEVVAVNLSATGPVDAVLMDLDSYEVQEERDDMPFSPRFAHDTRSVDWMVQPTSPVCTMVLVVFNPGVDSVQVEVIVRAVPAQSAIESGGSGAGETGRPVTHGNLDGHTERGSADVFATARVTCA
jgi:hypothetical protein